MRTATASARPANDEAARREHEELVSLLAHDLQEPTRMVRSFMELLDKQYGEQLDDRASEYVRFALDGARRMQESVGDLLVLSRVTRRGREPEPVACDAAIDKALEGLADQVFASGVRLEREELPIVLADPDQLVSLFEILLDNALRFRSDEPLAIQVSAVTDDDFHTITVRDNGIGFDPKHAESVFLPFRKLGARDASPGTGSGLAIARRIVQRHGGSIRATSAPGEGTTFSFELPRPVSEGA